MSLRLKILTPTAEKYHGRVKGLTVETLAGQITVLADHEPLITFVKAGPARIIDNQDKRLVLELSEGFLEKTPDNELNLLID